VTPQGGSAAFQEPYVLKGNDKRVSKVQAKYRLNKKQAQATLQRTPTRSFLEPRPFVATGDEEQISVIDRALAKFRSFAKPAREKAAVLDDQTTAALFGKLASTIDAQIWFLRSPSRLNDKLQPGKVSRDVHKRRRIGQKQE
jgi:hypothetical protein